MAGFFALTGGVPGKFYTLTFDLQSEDQIIPSGQRIGLMLFSGDRDFKLRTDAEPKLSTDLG